MTQMPRKAEHMLNIVDSGKDDTCGRRRRSQVLAGARAAHQHVKTASLRYTHASQNYKSRASVDERKVSNLSQ